MTTTFERLRAILMKDYRLASDQLTRDAPLEYLGIDSLGTIELLWSIEEVFKIKLPADPVKLLTLGEVVDFIDGLVAQQGRAALSAPPGESTVSAR